MVTLRNEWLACFFLPDCHSCFSAGSEAVRGRRAGILRVLPALPPPSLAQGTQKIARLTSAASSVLSDSALTSQQSVLSRAASRPHLIHSP